jgi:hypothetical protein
MHEFQPDQLALHKFVKVWSVLNFGNYYDSPDIQDGGDSGNSCGAS